jgi:imidazolonepropionase-like amidohydrolase
VIKVATSGAVLSPRDDPRHGPFRDAELAVLVEEATAAGRFVMAHAQATDGIKAAIRNGIRSIEHGIYLDDEAIGMMLERGMYLVPTLMAPARVPAAAGDKWHSDAGWRRCRPTGTPTTVLRPACRLGVGPASTGICSSTHSHGQEPSSCWSLGQAAVLTRR